MINHLIEVEATPHNVPCKFAIIVNRNLTVCEAVQKHLFDKFDARWEGLGNPKDIKHLDIEVIYVTYANGRFSLTWGSLSYLRSKNGEIPEYDFKITATLSKKTKTVVIDGKIYSEQEVLNLFHRHGLTPLESQ